MPSSTHLAEVPTLEIDPAAHATRPLTSEQCQLLERHYPQVRAVVSQMRHYLPSFADLDELHSVGLTGLIAAVRRFHPTLSKTFEAYAALRIRGAILDELRRLDAMPRSARQQARRLRNTMAALEQQHGRAPTDEETRTCLGLDPEEFARLRTRTQPVRFVPLDQPVQRNNNGSVNLHEVLADEDAPATQANLEHSEVVAELVEKLQLLPERQRKILVLYYYDGLRLAEIATVFGVTEARICQIHGQALQFLRQKWTERN
jgi:RNA polymerase sigma factor for flagellar operon FliA